MMTMVKMVQKSMMKKKKMMKKKMNHLPRRGRHRRSRRQRARLRLLLLQHQLLRLLRSAEREEIRPQEMLLHQQQLEGAEIALLGEIEDRLGSSWS